MTGPAPDEDVELVPGDPAISGDQPEPVPDAQPEPRQPSPEDDPVEEDDDEPTDDGR